MNEHRDDMPTTAAGFADLSRRLLADHDEAATAQRVCDFAVSLIPGADLCGLTVRRRRGRLETLAQTDQLALTCDELQYDLGEGPCMESALEDEPFLIRSTAEDPRWPTWGPKVAALGVHSLISVQLSADTIDADRDPLGAVNLYARRVDALSPADLQAMMVYAVHAANALAAAKLVTSLREAVDGRHHIGVAQGILVQRYGLSIEQAFEALQRFSSNTNQKLRDVATAVISSGELPDGYEQGATSG